MRYVLQTILNEAGDHSSIHDIQPVSGGSISEAYKLTTAKGRYFVKYNRNAAEDFFEKEAEGLRLLRRAGTLRVPEVYHYSTANSAVQGYIVMEWLEGEAARETEDRLGKGLALLHRKSHDHYGLVESNYIGKLPQPNGWSDNWITFFRDRRLGYQARLAEKRGYLTHSRRTKLNRLLHSLDQWIPAYEQPVLLHGDLWSGNWLVGPEGEPCLIDPAVFYGERELELAFTELFGGFSRRFYDAYEEMNPLSENYEERKQLYQLYYLLVHLTLFGESYGPAVDRVLAYYVG